MYACNSQSNKSGEQSYLDDNEEIYVHVQYVRTCMLYTVLPHF